jgi:hypothetical protein
MSPTLVHGHSPDQLDSAWKCALEYLPVECLTLCFPAVAATLDLSRPFTVLDAELHHPADGAAPSASACHADRIWRCIANDGRPVILHIEIQCQRDERFAERMFIYLALLFAKYRLPVISLAVRRCSSANNAHKAGTFCTPGCQMQADRNPAWTRLERRPAGTNV